MKGKRPWMPDSARVFSELYQGFFFFLAGASMSAPSSACFSSSSSACGGFLHDQSPAPQLDMLHYMQYNLSLCITPCSPDCCTLGTLTGTCMQECPVVSIVR